MKRGDTSNQLEGEGGQGGGEGGGREGEQGGGEGGGGDRTVDKESSNVTESQNLKIT